MLTKCSECGHDVSTEAEKCPNCGAPVKQESSIKPILPQPKDALFIRKKIIQTVLQSLFGLGAIFGGTLLFVNGFDKNNLVGIAGMILFIAGFVVLVINSLNAYYIRGYFFPIFFSSLFGDKNQENQENKKDNRD